MTTRSGLIVLTVLGWCLTSGAQNVSSGTQLDIPQEKLRLEQEREASARFYSEQDAQCRTKFAVSGCLKDVNRQRLAKLALVKVEELKIKDMERALRAQEQQGELERRAADRQLQIQSLETPEIRSPKVPKNAAIDGVLALPDPAASRIEGGSISAELQAANRDAYQKKQIDAEKRKQDRDRRLLEKKPKPLGLPAGP